jgi:hypothetical protein
VRQENWLIFVHVVAEDAFVARPQLTYEAGSLDGDYDSRTYRTNFENWAKETLIPNIPEEPVVVFDSAPFQCAQADKLRSEYTVKTEMISRLRRQRLASCHYDATSAVQQKIIQYTLTQRKKIQIYPKQDWSL